MTMSRFAFVALLAIAAPAAAQDGSETATQRTVEGAQSFLGGLYARGGAQAAVGIWHSGGDWIRGWAEKPGYKWASLRGDVVGLEPESRCKNRLIFANPKLDSHQMQSPNTPFTLAGNRVEEIVHWDRIASVKLAEEERGDGQGNRVKAGWWRINLLYYDRNSVRFYHLSEEDAQRAAAAIEFLRLNCGQNSDSGF
jgi:hypothetical protein